jgi:hypothetical protein
MDSQTKFGNVLMIPLSEENRHGQQSEDKLFFSYRLKWI